MTSKRKIPPAVIRYRKAHPTVSCTLTSELKVLLDQKKGNLSYGAFIKKLLMGYINPYGDGRKTGYTEGYKAGSEAGYENGKEEYRIWYNCNVCGNPLTIKPNSEAHEAVLKLMKDAGWGHAKCHEKKEHNEMLGEYD